MVSPYIEGSLGAKKNGGLSDDASLWPFPPMLPMDTIALHHPFDISDHNITAPEHCRVKAKSLCQNRGRWD